MTTPTLSLYVTTTGAAGYFACDLSSLSSVQGFAKAWGSSTPIDVLCLNAGLAPNTRDPAPQYVNHFIQYC